MFATKKVEANSIELMTSKLVYFPDVDITGWSFACCFEKKKWQEFQE